MERYARINPLFGVVLFDMAEGESRSLVEAVDVPAFRRSRFYREWVEPQGWGDWVGSILARSNSNLAMLAVARKERDGAFKPEQLAYLRLLTPHIRRAVELGRMFDPRAGVGQALSALVERFAAAAILIDAEGRIAYANSRAEALIAEGEILRASYSRVLRAAETPAGRAVAHLLSRPGASADMKTVQTARGPCVVSVTPPSSVTGGLTMVLVSASETARPPPGPLLREAFNLTHSESRVLAELLVGHSLAEAADNLGVTQRTIKAHLQNLFLKTGVTRQSELIRKVMSFTPPFE